MSTSILMVLELQGNFSYEIYDSSEKCRRFPVMLMCMALVQFCHFFQSIQNFIII